MPTTQASPAVGDFTPNAVSKRVRAKLMPLPSYRKRIFRSAVKVKPFGRASATLTEIEYPLLVKRVFKPSPPRHRGYAAKPPTAAADASRLCRPRRRRRPSGTSRKRSLQEGKGKAGALTLLSQAYFSECCQGQALRARKRDLDRDRIPAFSKAGIQAIPLPATAATPLSPRRPPPMRVGYADHAGVAGRRGLHTKRSLQEGKGKTDALTLLSQAYFSECCQGQALRARKRDLDRDRIPAFSKAGIQAIPSPPPRLRR